MAQVLPDRQTIYRVAARNAGDSPTRVWLYRRRRDAEARVRSLQRSGAHARVDHAHVEWREGLGGEHR